MNENEYENELSDDEQSQPVAKMLGYVLFLKKVIIDF